MRCGRASLSSNSRTSEEASATWLNALCFVARLQHIAAEPATLARPWGRPPIQKAETTDPLWAAKHLGLKAKRNALHYLNLENCDAATGIDMKRRTLISTLATASTAPLLGGCDKLIEWMDRSQDTVFDWTEDVPLQNGTMAVVKRTARLSANHIAGGGGGSFNRGMTLQITSPQQKELPGPWSDVYVPLLLDYDSETNEWFLVATFFHCDSWYNLGRPALPYTEYRFRQGRWQRQDLSPKLIGRKANLYIADHPPKAPHLTTPAKQDEVEPGTGKEYLMIVSQWASGC